MRREVHIAMMLRHPNIIDTSSVRSLSFLHPPSPYYPSIALYFPPLSSPARPFSKLEGKNIASKAGPALHRTPHGRLPFTSFSVCLLVQPYSKIRAPSTR